MKYTLLILWALLLSGCEAKAEKYVALADEVVPKTAMVEVDTIVKVMYFVFDSKGLQIEISTVPVTFRGAAVFISPSGHLLTCAHLFDSGYPSTTTIITATGLRLPAEVLYQSEEDDLALLKIENDWPHYARLGDPRELRVGQEVLAVGNPLGFEFSVTHGIISALNRDQVGLYNATQSDAFINPGNSGGPLFNLRGELVGINSRFMPANHALVFSGLGFSVSPGQILEFITKFRGLDQSLPKYDSDYWATFKKMVWL